MGRRGWLLGSSKHPQRLMMGAPHCRMVHLPGWDAIPNFYLYTDLLGCCPL